MTTAQSEANELLLENRISNLNEPITKLFDLTAFAYPEKFLTDEGFTKLVKLFIEKHTNDYQELNSDEQIDFWARGFAHHELFRNLFITTYQQKIGNEKYEWMWKMIFTSIRLNSQTFQGSIFSLFCQQYEDSGIFVAEVLQVLVTSDIQLSKKFSSEQENLLRPFTETLLRMAQSYLEAEKDPDTVLLYCKQCLGHPAITRKYLSSPNKKIIIMPRLREILNYLNYFVSNYINKIPFKEDDLKEMLGDIASQLFHLNEQTRVKISFLAEIKKTLTELASKNYTFKSIHWVNRYHEKPLDDDAYHYFLERMFGVGSACNENALSFMKETNVTDGQYPKLALAFAQATSITKPVEQWAETATFAEIFHLVMESDQFDLFKIAITKKEWENTYPRTALDYVKRSRSPVLYHSLIKKTLDRELPWEVWLAVHALHVDMVPF